MSKRRCLFCDKEEKLTREHIYPSWLFDFISLKETTFKPGIHGFEVSKSNLHADKPIEGNFSDGRVINYDDFKYKIICESCNSGWMSTLEQDVRTIIKDYISDENVVLNISHSQAYLLSQWAIKTILVINKVNNSFEFDIRIPQMIKDGIIPEGFMVEMLSLPFKELNYFINGPLTRKTFKIQRELLDSIYNNIFISALQIGHLCFRISYLRTEYPIYRKQIVKKINVLFPYETKLPFEEIQELEIENKLVLPIICAQLAIVD